MAKIKGVHKSKKWTNEGPIWHHYTRKAGGTKFWRGGLDDDDKTEGYRDAYEAATGNKAKGPEAPELKETVHSLARKWRESREWSGLASRTQADYSRGMRDVESKFGNLPAEEFLNDPDAGGIVIGWIEKQGWQGKEGDVRFDAIKCLASWASERFRGAYPRSQFKGLKKFYKNPGRAEVIWSDGQVEACIAELRQNLSDAVVFARDIGGRIGDLVKLGPQHVKPRKDGGKAIIFKTSKGRRHKRVMNVVATPRVLAIIERTPKGQATFLTKASGEPWGEKELSKEVMEGARQKKLVPPGLRFNDLRGTRATELAWDPETAVPEMALQMGWGIENAARMMGVYAAINPDTLSGKPRAAPEA